MLQRTTCNILKALFHGLLYHRGGAPSPTVSGCGAGHHLPPSPSAVIAKNRTRGLALAQVTSTEFSHEKTGEPTQLFSGEPLALRAPEAWSMTHMPPTSSPTRPDGALANHVRKPPSSLLPTHHHLSVALTSRPTPGVQPLDAAALPSRSTLDV